MSLEYPLLSNSISVDVQKLNEFLEALTKLNPTEVDGISAGAKRLVEVSSGKWQWQEYNGSSWAAVPFLQHNVDQLDGYHAAITPAANTVAVRNASGLLQDSITGNAATASSAATLSQTLPVNKGGTGATTSEAARSNLGVPPTSHASANTTHGVGNATQYGHLKLSDAANNSSGVSGGVAATPAAVKAAKEAADAAQSSADAAMTKASTLATASTPGIVKPGTGMTVDKAGALNVSLNNTVTSTSTTQAATANAVKTAYDKAEEAASKAGLPLGHIFAWPFPTAPDGCIILNGSTYNRNLYTDLFAYIKSKGWTKTETEWQNIAQANSGFCPWYSEGDGSTTFRTPKFAPYQKIALASGDAGKYYKAGLPNIVGEHNGNPWISEGSGAFKVSSVTSTIPSGEVTGKNNVIFDASLYNPIYGRSITVQPESHDWIICAVAFGTATNVGSVDVANVMSAVGQVQAEVSTKLEDSTVHVVETWKSTDGKTSCRKWSDGLIEQWGIQTNTGSKNRMIVTLPWNFSNTNYHIFVSPKTNNADLVSGSSGVVRSSNSFYTITEGYKYQSFWYACGY